MGLPAKQVLVVDLVAPLDHVWVIGRVDVLVRVDFMTSDGVIAMTGKEIEDRGEPGRYTERNEVHGKRFSHDWDAFEDGALDLLVGALYPRRAGPEEWWHAQRQFLENMHDRFGAFPADRPGLGEFDTSSERGVAA